MKINEVTSILSSHFSPNTPLIELSHVNVDLPEIQAEDAAVIPKHKATLGEDDEDLCRSLPPTSNPPPLRPRSSAGLWSLRMRGHVTLSARSRWYAWSFH